MPNNAIMIWTPDTCGDLASSEDRCQIHLAYDDSVAYDKRAFTYVTWEQAQAIHQARLDAHVPNTNSNPQPPSRICSAHQALGTTPALLTQVQSENRRKNMTFGLAQNSFSALAFVIGDDKGNTQKLAMYNWSFDASRVLEVTFVGITLTNTQKNQLQSVADTQFGPNLVKVK